MFLHLARPQYLFKDRTNSILHRDTVMISFGSVEQRRAPDTALDKFLKLHRHPRAGENRR